MTAISIVTDYTGKTNTHAHSDTTASYLGDTTASYLGNKDVLTLGSLPAQFRFYSLLEIALGIS